MAISTAVRRIRALSLLATLMPLAVVAGDEPIAKFAGAVETGDLETVQKMLAAGLDPNTRVPGSHLGYTPLFLAVRANRPAITEALLKAGADVSAEDGNGDPVMVHAADKDRLEQARILIRHGVSIDARNSSGITALMRGAPYENAADVQTNLDLGANPDLTDREGNTALTLAAASGNLAAVEVLLKAGANPDILNKAGKTALMLVLSSDVGFDKEKVPEIVKLLIKGGADFDLRDPQGNTVLITALESHRVNPETIQAILEAKPDVTIRDNDGQDAIYHAVLHGREKIHLPRLLELGGNLKTTRNDGMDLLMQAAGRSDPELVRYLLEQGLAVDRKSASGETAVHRAARAGRWESDSALIEATAKRAVEVLKLLHQQGASLTTPDADGDTPLHSAAMSASTAVASYLLPFYENPNIPNLKGEIPLHVAAFWGDSDIVDLFLSKCPDADVRDADGRTALMNASASGLGESVLSLIKAGAKIDATDKAGISALAAAVAADDSGQIQFLLEYGASPETLYSANSELLRLARRFHTGPVNGKDYSYLFGFLAEVVRDIDARDADQMTALMWVAASNNPTALEAVMKSKPDLQARSPDGRTALMWAACSRAESSVSALRKAGADASLRDSAGRNADEWLAWSNRQEAEIPSPAGDDAVLLESLANGRRAALKDYLGQGKWNKDDRLAGSSPMHLAAALGDVDALKVLLERGAPPDQTLWDLSTPLMEAAINGKTEAAGFLLDRGADATRRDANGQRAIDRAIYLKQADVARLLLHRENSLSTDESSLLAALARSGDEALLREFLKAGASIPPPDRRSAGADPFDRDRPSPEAPLVAAAIRTDTAILKILVEFAKATGADDPRLLAIALHFAAENGSLANVRFLVGDHRVSPDTLLTDSFGGVTRINPGAQDGKGKKPVEGYSALSRALEEGHVEIVRYLVEHGATVTGRTRGGEPPSTFVIAHRQPDLLKFFLENKAATDAVDLSGVTALHVAAAADDSEATRLLLEHGADPEAKSSNGQTPLDMARRVNAAKTVTLLETRTK